MIQYIKQCYDQSHYQRCYDQCQLLWQSHINHQCVLNSEQVKQVLFYQYVSQPKPQSKPQPQVESTVIYCLQSSDNPEMVLKLNCPVIIWSDKPLSIKRDNLMIDHQSPNDTHRSMWVSSIKLNPFKTKTFICLSSQVTADLREIETWQVPDQIKMIKGNSFPPLITGSGENLLKYLQSDGSTLPVIEYYYGDPTAVVTNYQQIRSFSKVIEILDQYLNARRYSEAQTLIDQIDYQYNNVTRYMFVHYSILTNYYSMSQQLNPLVIDLLNDPKYESLRMEILKVDGNNLNYYPDKHLLNLP